MSGSIGSVSISVVPSAVGFSDKLRETLLPEADDLGVEIGDHIRQGIEEALAETSFTITANTQQAEADVDDLRAKTDGLSTSFVVTANTEEANAGVDELDAKLAGISAQDHVADITASTGEATAAIDQLGGSLAGAAAGSEELQNRLDAVSGASEHLADWLADLDAAASGSGESMYDEATALEGAGMAARRLGFALQDVGEALTATGPEAAESVGGLEAEAAALAETAAAAKAAKEALKDGPGGGGGSGGGGVGFLGAILGVALAIGPAFIAAAAGEAIFAGAAIPDILAIVHNTAPFANELADVKSEYLQLAAAVRPEVFSDFDIALDQAKDILPEFTDVAKAGGVALGQFLGQFGSFLHSGDSEQFLKFVQGAVGPDVHAFANLFQGGTTAAQGFAESLNGISKTLLNVTGGILSGVGEVLKEVPQVGQFAVALGATYVAVQKLSGAEEALSLGGFAKWLIGGEEGLALITAEFVAADSAATYFDATMVALDAISPWVWAAAGAVAIGAMVGALVSSYQPISDVTNELKQQYDATGYNVTGWKNYADALNTNVAVGDKLSQGLATTFEQMHDGISTTQQVASTASQASQQSANLSSRLAVLGQMFGVGRNGAIEMAEGAKVSATQLAAIGPAGDKAFDTVKAFGEAGAKSASETTQFAADMADAKDQALSLTTRVQDLTTALNNESNATDTGINALATFQGGMVTLEQDMDKSGDKAGYFTSKQRATAEELATLDGAAKAASEAILQQGGSATKAAGPLEELRGEMEKIQDPTKAERELLRELNREIQALKSKNITIGINVLESTSSYAQAAGAEGSSATPPPQLHFSTGPTGLAEGGRIPGYGGGDTYGPIMVERGETIVPKHLTPRFAPQFAAAGIPGFASGGIPGGADKSLWNATEFDFSLFMSIAGNNSLYSSSQSGIDAANRLGQEFANGTLQTVKEIRAAGVEAIDALKDYYTGPHSKELQKVLGDQVTALEKLAGKSADIASEIKNMKAFAAQETQSLKSFSDLSAITGTVNSATGVTAAPTGSQIQAGLAKDLAQLKKFYSLIGQLKHKGVNGALIQQVIAMDPATGIEYAEAILSGGEKLIHEINSEEKKINSEEVKIGDRAAEIKYGQSISKGFLSGLRKDQDKLDKEMKRLGDKIALELEHALHGKTIKLTAKEAKTVADATDVTTADVSSVGGTTAAATHMTASQMTRLITGINDVAHRETLLLTKAQGTEIIALLKAAPKATGAAAGSSLADALDSAAGKAVQKARASVRRPT